MPSACQKKKTIGEGICFILIWVKLGMKKILVLMRSILFMTYEKP